MKKRTISLILLAVLAGAIFGACGAGGGSKREMSTGAAPAQEAKPAAPGQAAPPGQVSSAPAPVDERKIIRNASFDVKVKDADATINKITSAVNASGGYVQETKQSGTKQSGRTTNMVLRVPAGQYAAMIDLVRGLGEITQQREWTDDVTEQFVDVEARIKTLELELNELYKIYGRTESVKELMEVEQRISQVTADLESLKGRLRVLSNRVDYSTIQLNLYEPGVPTPIEPPKTVWERMRFGFRSSWNGVVNFTGDLVVFVVSALPVLVYLAVLGLILFLVIRGLQKVFGNRRRNLPPQGPQGPLPMHFPGNAPPGAPMQGPPPGPQDPNQPRQ